MSKPKVFEKPTGVKDYLPEAAAKLRRIENNVLSCMAGWGYREIMTPTLEYYDTVGSASSTEDRKLFKLLDYKGTTMVMRSDMTAPIARVVASLLKEQPFPIRLSYHANVFRALESEAGRDAEFFQTGVELVGDASPESDAEVIALAIASLQAAGVSEFKIAVGHVGFLNGLFRGLLPGQPEAQDALKACLMARDYVGYRDMIKQLGVSEQAEEGLTSMLRLRGGQEVCDQAEQASSDQEALSSIAHLCKVWDVLKAYGVTEHVLIDLTMIGDIGYYTGMTFEGYASNLGFPVCSGGRYDRLLQQFGRSAPATGFALKTNRILEVIQSESADGLTPVMIVYTENNREEALKRASQLRASGEGRMVVTKLVDEAYKGRAGNTETHQPEDYYSGILGVKVVEMIEFVS